MLTIHEAAKFLGVSTKTLRRWDSLGQLKSERTNGDHRRYARSVLKKFQNLRKQKKEITTFPLVARNDKQVRNSLIVENSPIQDFQIQKLEVREYRGSNKFAFKTTLLFILIFIISLLSLTFGKFFIDGLREHKSVSEILSETKTLIAANNANLPNSPAVLADTASVFDSDLKVNIPAIFNSSVNFMGIVAFNNDLTDLNHTLDLGDTGKIIASNLIYKLNAGKDISITGGPCQNNASASASLQCPTIAFNGVSSINILSISTVSGQTISTSSAGTGGVISLLSGSGISLSTVTSTESGSQITITNSDKGSSQNIFKHIKVSNDTIDTSGNDDTLTIAGGTGISFSTDTGNKKFTISASGSDLNASGWVDDGTSVRLATSTDKVGIGTSSPSGPFSVGTTSQFQIDLSGNVSTSGTINSLTLTSQSTGFTIAGGTSSKTLTLNDNISLGTTIQPTASNSLIVESNGANALTLDTGGAAAINIGNTNASSLAFGNTSSNPTYAFNGSGSFTTSTGTNTLSGNTVIASGKSFLTSTGIATAVAGVATLNQQAGVVTTDDLTGHDNASNYTITVNNSMVTANSFVFYNIVHGSDSIGNPNCFNSNTFTPGSNGSFQVSIRFMGTLPCVANGNEKVNFLILNPQ